MDSGVVEAIEKLRKLGTSELQKLYQEMIGKPHKSSSKLYLFRRIAWNVQAQSLGDLSERARRRATQIANEAEFPARHSRNSDAPSRTQPASPLVSARSRRDWRLPPPGTLIARRCQGRDVLVKVLEDGFEYQARHFSSLSAIAREVTGTRWNGFLFFGLTERRDG